MEIHRYTAELERMVLTLPAHAALHSQWKLTFGSRIRRLCCLAISVEVERGRGSFPVPVAILFFRYFWLHFGTISCPGENWFALESPLFRPVIARNDRPHRHVQPTATRRANRIGCCSKSGRFSI